MDIQVKDLGGLAREIAVTIPKKTVEEKFNARLKAVAAQMNLPGFRPGKVPLHIAEERHGEKVFHEIENDLIQEGLKKASEDHKLVIAGTSGIDHDHKHEVADFSFTAKIDVMPEIKPTALEKIKLTRETAKPDAKMMEESLADLQKRMQQFKEKDGKAAMGDRVTVQGQGYVNDEAFDGGNLQNFPIELGSGGLIPGFEEQLEGAKAGDKVEVKVPFPKDYHAEELAGKDSVFKLEVLKVEAPETQELNDEFAKQLGQESMAKLNALVETSLQRDLDSATEQRTKRQLFDHLESKHDFDVPASMTERELAGLMQSQVNEAQRRGLPLPDEKNMKKDLEPIAIRRVKLGLLLAEIAKAQKLEVAPQDLQQEIQKQVQQAGPQAQQVAEYFSDPRNQQQLVGPIMEEKVVTWLMESAEITEKEIKAEDLVKEFT